MYLNCCDGLYLAKIYKLKSSEDEFCYLYYLNQCPVCFKPSVALKKYFRDGSYSSFRKKHTKALRLFEKLKSEIDYEIKTDFSAGKHGFYLGCNEHGSKKRCYQNISSMQLGRYEGLMPPNHEALKVRL